MRASWEQLQADIAGCTRCELCRTRTNVVPGEGDPRARLMFIGEGPGYDEDRQGRPFVGRSGQLLTSMISAMGMTREEVYICNVVKCRPPQNRDPLPEEAAACMDYLRAQFVLVRPKVIVLLGRIACRYVLKEDISVSRVHGTWYERKGVWFMPTFHPSALLRDPSKKREAWDDLQKVMAKLAELAREEAADERPE